MINVCKVSRFFGSLKAVDEVTLRIEQGEVFGLVGPDGAGKTTLIRMMLGILAASAGEITVMGCNDIEKVKSGIGYVPQKFSLYGDLTVMENIELMGAMYGASRIEIAMLADEILTMTNLVRFKGRLADQLSGGMKQKLALAAGLMHKPHILFLDEPTTGVDPVSRREFWQMLYRLNREGMTIMVSTPYMDEAELCTRIAFMYNGRIIADDAPKVLCATYPYVLYELSTARKDVKRLLRDCSIRDINSFGEKYHIVVEHAKQIGEVKRVLEKAGIDINGLRKIEPTLEDFFVELAQG